MDDGQIVAILPRDVLTLGYKEKHAKPGVAIQCSLDTHSQVSRIHTLNLRG